MKAKIFFAGLLFAVFFFYSSSYSQVPQMINYQGRLTDTTGVAIDTTVSMTFAIYTDSVGADSVWSETQDPVIVEDGTFNVLLGSVTPIPNSAFDGSIRYLGVKVGDDDEMSPRRPLVSAAYAFRSEWADTTEFCYIESVFYDTIQSDGDWEFSDTNIYRLEGNVGIGTNEPQYKLDVEGNIHASGSIKSGNSLELVGDSYWLITDIGEMYFGRDPATGSFEDVKVGIGTTNPNAALQVNGAISRQNTILHGDNAHTHVNLGVACTTGTSGENFGYCTVGGGSYNAANGWNATVAGGALNTASGWDATVAGGFRNTARGELATVGGGVNNTASGDSATVGGGAYNIADGLEATVGGGAQNAASGWCATVSGGYANTAAGGFSFAAGNSVRVTAGAGYTFAFGRDFTTSTPNAVIFHNSVDDISVGIGTTSPEAMLHVAGTIQGEEAFFFDEDANVADIWDAVIGFSYPQGTPFDRRLRITAGRDDGEFIGNSQGAAIDLHGNNFPFGDKNGDLDLVAGEGIPGARGDIIFWTGEDGAQPRMVIDTLGRVGIGTTSPNTRVDIDGDIALRDGQYSLFLYNGNNNNLQIGQRSFGRITGPTAAFTITGIAGGTNGKVVILFNSTTQNMTIANESTNSLAENRIWTMSGSNETTVGTGNVTLIYAGDQRWIVIAWKP